MKRNYLLDLRDILEARTGLYLPAEKLDRLEEPFKDSRGSLGSTSPQRVIQAIGVDSAEGRDYLNKLIAAVATNETYFFRTSPHFEALKNYLLPELLREKLAAGKKSLRIWSAGCSTGEEPYSLAILLLDNFPELRAWQTTILASDIDLDALERAQQGIYRPWSFRGVDPDVIKKHFHAEKGERYRIDERIGSLVIFQPLNLKSDPYPSSFYGTTELDIILCRNVTIYFRPETIQEVIGKFYDCLVEGGFLLTGAAEYSSKIYRDFEVRAFPETVIYQKPVSQKKPARPNPASPLLPRRPVPLSRTPAPTHGKIGYACAEKEQRHPLDEALGLISQGEMDQALVLLAQLAEKNPRDSRISFLLGQIAADRHHLSEAFHWLSQTLAQDPLHRHAYYLLGLLWMEEGKLDEALQSLQKTVYIDPNFALGHFYIGRIYKEQGQIKKARQSLALVKSLLGSTGLSDPLAGAEGMTAQQLLILVDRELNHEG